MVMNILFDLMYVNADGEIDSKTLTVLFYTLAVISFLIAAVVFFLHFKEWIFARIVKYSTTDVQTFEPYPKN
tara:strand:+ start:49 stop:264 length:216 start_codon:yes stop_codon:yes gene_type:complete